MLLATELLAKLPPVAAPQPAAAKGSSLVLAAAEFVAETPPAAPFSAAAASSAQSSKLSNKTPHPAYASPMKMP
jgi:hypothetical protein